MSISCSVAALLAATKREAGDACPASHASPQDVVHAVFAQLMQDVATTSGAVDDASLARTLAGRLVAFCKAPMVYATRQNRIYMLGSIDVIVHTIRLLDAHAQIHGMKDLPGYPEFVRPVILDTIEA